MSLPSSLPRKAAAQGMKALTCDQPEF